MTDRLPPGQSGRGRIDGPAGVLEVLVEPPRGTPPLGVVVIAHPHPVYGGTLDNKVTYMLARGVQDGGAVAVRFNFRGVGQSAGSHAQGRGEQDDLSAVVAYARQGWPSLPVALAGFSFGSYMALARCADLDARGVLTIAPPLAYAAEQPVPDPGAPWWMLHGDADEVVDYADTVSRAQGAARPPEILETAPGVGHFFHGELPQVRAIAQRFVSAVLG